MTDDQAKLKAEYRRVAARRREWQQIVNEETAKWNGRDPKPDALLDAERNRDDADVDLARLADRIKL
jgi:hypothetical protein